MRVLQVHNRYRERGGEDAVVEAEAAVLRAAGHTVIEHAAVNPDGTLASARALGTSAWNRKAAAAVVAAAREGDVDVAHVHNTWFSLTAAVVAALDRAGIPVAATLHNYRLLCVNAQLFRDGGPCEDCVGSTLLHGVVHRCYRGSAAASAVAAAAIGLNRRTDTWERHVTRFLALNEFARGRFVAGGLPAGRIVVKPNFVADPGPRDLPPSTSRTVLYVGRLTEEKGVRTLLEAWALAQPSDLELLVVGDGPLRASLAADAPPGVTFTGFQPSEEVSRSMFAARALVFPSRWYEGQPVTVLEAMARGLPVLASDLGGTPELLAGQGRAWLARPGDTVAWAAALHRLQGDGADDRVDTGGAAGRVSYEAGFTPAAGLRGLEGVYEAILTEGPRSALSAAVGRDDHGGR